MRSRQVIVPLLLLALLGTTTAVRAATPWNALVVSARTAGFVDLVFEQAVVIDSQHLRVYGGKGVAGFYLQPLDGAADGGTGAVLFRAMRVPQALTHSAFGDWAAEPVPVTSADVSAHEQLEPRRVSRGRYRLRVIADGPVTLSIPLQGSSTRRLRADGRIAVTSLVRDVTDAVLPRLPAASVPGAVRVDLPFPVAAARAITFTSVQVVQHGEPPITGAVSMDACLDTRERPHCDAQYTPRHSDAMVDGPAEIQQPSGRWAQARRLTRYYYPSLPGPHPAGPEHAYYYAMATNVDRVVVTALSLGL